MKISRIFTRDELTLYEETINLPHLIRLISSLAVLIAVTLLLVEISGDGEIGTRNSLFFLLVFSLLTLLLNQLGYHRLAGLGLFSISLLVVTYNVFTNDGLYDMAMLAYPLILVLVGLAFGPRYLPLATIFIVFIIGGLYFLSTKGMVQPFNGRVPVGRLDSITVGGMLLIVGALMNIMMRLVERHVERIIQSEERLRKTYESTLVGWSHALELREQEPEGHNKRVVDLTLSLSKQMGLREEQLIEIRWGALLHDIGKIGVPDGILQNPGSLSEEDKKIIQRHPELAQELLGSIPILETAMKIPYSHHESWDGSGYPEGLRGEKIPLEARIFTVCDVYDSLTSDRPYASPWSHSDAIAYLQEHSGRYFDPAVVEEFVVMLSTDG
jgi:hypothetical protein